MSSFSIYDTDEENRNTHTHMLETHTHTYSAKPHERTATHLTLTPHRQQGNHTGTAQRPRE